MAWIARRRKLKFLRADGSEELMVTRNTRSQYESKKNQRMPVVRMPVSSFGICANKYCESSKLLIELETGDGMCQLCYDRGAGGRGHIKLSKTGRKIKENKRGENE